MLLLNACVRKLEINVHGSTKCHSHENQKFKHVIDVIDKCLFLLYTTGWLRLVCVYIVKYCARLEAL